MLHELLAVLASSPVPIALKTSRYVYPVVNAIHIMGLAALFGAIFALDLRLLGAFVSVPAHSLATILPRVAACGLAVAVASGLLLFSANPFDYVANRAFLAKVSLVLIGTLHAIWVHMTSGWRDFRSGPGTIGGGLRVSAAISLLAWSGAILAGRFIAF